MESVYNLRLSVEEIRKFVEWLEGLIPYVSAKDAEHVAETIALIENDILGRIE